MQRTIDIRIFVFFLLYFSGNILCFTPRNTHQNIARSVSPRGSFERLDLWTRTKNALLGLNDSSFWYFILCGTLDGGRSRSNNRGRSRFGGHVGVGWVA